MSIVSSQEIMDQIYKTYESQFKKVFAEWTKGWSTHLPLELEKYNTEAKNTSLDVCENLWICKMGAASFTTEQIALLDEFFWEIGKKLFDAGRFIYDPLMEEYKWK